jgi:hypothetical protein
MTISRISRLEIEALDSVAFLDWGVGERTDMVVEKKKGYCIQGGRQAGNWSWIIALAFWNQV